MVLSELIDILQNQGGGGGPIKLLGEALISVGNFAQQTGDAQATAALCFAGADAIRAARKVYSAID